MPNTFNQIADRQLDLSAARGQSLQQRLKDEHSIEILRDRLNRGLGDRLAAEPDGFCAALAVPARTAGVADVVRPLAGPLEIAALAARRDPEEAACERRNADQAVVGRYAAGADSRSTFVALPPEFDYAVFGHPEERLYIYILNRQNWFGHLARIYWQDGDPKYLDALNRDWDYFWDHTRRADETFRGQTHGIGDWKKHVQPPYWTLDVSVRQTNWYWAFWLSVFAPETSPERIAVNLARCLIHFDVVASTGVVDKRCNYAAMHGESQYLWASSLPEVIGMEIWRHNTRVLLESSLAEAILPDGVQYEMSPSYHAGCIKWYGTPALAARRRGEPFDAEYSRRLHAMGEVADALQCPDRCDAPLSDSERIPSNLRGLAMAKIFSPGLTTRRPCPPSYYSVWVSSGMDRDPQASVTVKPRNVTMPHGGYAVVMTDPGPTASYAVIDCGPTAFPHNHHDVLALYWEAFGRPVLVDPGIYKYIGDANRTWVRSAESHNLIMPEEKPPEPPGYSDQGPAVFQNIDSGRDPRLLPLRADDLGGVLRLLAGHRVFTIAPDAAVERTVWMSGDGARPWLVVRDRIDALHEREWTSSWLLPGKEPLIVDGPLWRGTLATGVSIALATAGLEGGRLRDEERFYTKLLGVIEPARWVRQTARCASGVRVSAWSASLTGPAPEIGVHVQGDAVMLAVAGSTIRLT